VGDPREADASALVAQNGFMRRNRRSREEAIISMNSPSGTISPSR